MNKKNKIFIVIFITGAVAIINGSFIKINGNLNADIILLSGLIMELISIAGLILNNLKKIKLFLKLHHTIKVTEKRLS